MRSPIRHAAVDDLIRKREWQRTLSTVGAVVIIPAACALLGAYTSEVEHAFGKRVTVSLWILSVAILAVLAASINPFGKSLVALIAESEELENTIAEKDSEIKQFAKSVDLLAIQASYANSVRAIVLNHAARRIIDMISLNESLGDIAVPLIYSGEELFGLCLGEAWSFSIYLYSRRQDLLIPVWREKSKHHPSGTSMGRQWGRGEGHVGKAFVDQKSIITGDSTATEAAPFSTVPQGKDRPYDNAYVSFASIPIGPVLAVDNRPYGILVGTSDRAGRFDRDNAGMMVQIAGAVASLLIAGNLDVDNYLTPPEEPQAVGEGGANGVEAEQG